MSERPSHYSAQTKARKAALDILFMAEQRGDSLSETFTEQRTLSGGVVRELTREIVFGVAEHLDEIDDRISAAASAAWPLDRMPSVDRNLARMAIFELDYTDTPPGAVISEAVRLAGDLSTDESPAFLNGLLAKAAGAKPNTN
ncbi:transcription antitermination factor NusB [Tessaracoccus sp. MC1865]|uniref:transcription antitermination factor NusB n=1 Tax=unclassified Tessaracoccus TaxID=2635419 RepID=UPI00096DF19E|nr:MULTISPECIES: transcription antitermination factor NusB [unclassified Tessaracoccus]MBB1484705.1 transcription antitermination factor NusB [Tessaracoccus sp. MC1865]MBB1510027.1 transcription antitermination factor NusB [Tessaracoccus sp. MC1756]MCG6566542.1 transcription antitermination factor NusB [Tessaracoccus sp. ZS01]OMG58975.1 transcription antitermination factor NusB [Tessaracoccus sp. ZS01]QTO36351.1 transcription antitermination factor NusB [Tessaracoccus sp. MC1865]